MLKFIRSSPITSQVPYACIACVLSSLIKPILYCIVVQVQVRLAVCIDTLLLNLLYCPMFVGIVY